MCRDDSELSGVCGDGIPAPVRAKALDLAGTIENYRGEHKRAQYLLEESAALYRATGDKRGLAPVLNSLGHAAADLGDWERAEALYQESMDLGRKLGDEERVYAGLNNLGWAAMCQEDYERAAELCRESCSLAESMGRMDLLRHGGQNLGWVSLGQGDPTEAAVLFKEALAFFREVGDQVNIAEILEGFAGVAGAQGEGERAGDDPRGGRRLRAGGRGRQLICPRLRSSENFLHANSGGNILLWVRVTVPLSPSTYTE